MPFRSEEVRRAARSRLPLRNDNSAVELTFLQNCMQKIADWRFGPGLPQGPFMLVLDEQGPDAAGSAAPQLVNLASAYPPLTADVFFCDERLTICQHYPGLMTDPSRASEAATSVQQNTRTYALIDPIQDRAVIVTTLFPGELVIHFAGARSGIWSLEALEDRLVEFSNWHLFEDPLWSFVYADNRLQERGRELCRNALFLYLCATLKAPGIRYRAIDGKVVAIRGHADSGVPVAATWAIGSRRCRSWKWTAKHAEKYVASAARGMAAAHIPSARVAFVTACDGVADVTDPTNRVKLRHVV